jgi:hypothetical protein
MCKGAHPHHLADPRCLLTHFQVSHGDFVTGWKALPRMAAEPVTDESDLPPHAADLVNVLSGRAGKWW